MTDLLTLAIAEARRRYAGPATAADELPRDPKNWPDAEIAKLLLATLSAEPLRTEQQPREGGEAVRTNTNPVST